MGRGAVAYEKNDCDRTRKRDHDNPTDRRLLKGDIDAARDKALGDPPPDPLGFNALMPIPKGGKKVGRHLAAPSVLAPGSALGSVPTVALSSAQVERNYSMPAAVSGTKPGPTALTTFSKSTPRPIGRRCAH